MPPVPHHTTTIPRHPPGKNNVFVTIQFPNTQASSKILPFAYADNVVVFLNTCDGFLGFGSAIADHEFASTGKVNEPKSIAIFPNPKGKVTDPMHWHSLIPYPTLPNDQERVELGLPFRPDGNIPQIHLRKIVNAARVRSLQWRNSRPQ